MLGLVPSKHGMATLSHQERQSRDALASVGPGSPHLTTGAPAATFDLLDLVNVRVVLAK